MTTFGSMSGRSTNKFNKIISFLTQKIIDSETSQREVFDSGEDNLPENIDMFDVEMERDLGTKSTLKQKANIFRMVEGATWTKSLRLWIKFQNAGHLYDYSRNGNFSEVYGLGQIPILMNKKVSDNVIGWEFHSFFNGFDQFAYTQDNTHIRVSEMFADSAVTHISFLDSFNPISIQKATQFETSVLFSKVDDDQIKDGFAATLDQRGNIYFYIKRDWKQYSLFLQGIYAAQLADEIANQGNFNAENFNSLDFNTDLGYTSDLICSITKSDDHWFVYDKATHVIRYMKNGVTVFDSTQNWVANDPVLDVPFQDGAYNADGSDRTQIHDVSGNNYHGTLSNPENGQWQENNTFFNFGSNTAGSGGGCKTTFPTIAALDSANDFTISFMYKPDNIVNTNSWFETIIRKSWQVDGSFIMYRPPSSGNITAEYRDPTGVKRFVTVVGGVTTTEWHSIILKCERSQPMKLIIDGVTYTGSSTLPATALTSVGVLEIGSVTTGMRGTICYFRVFDSALGTTDIQRLVDEGYHNPVFPKSEKPQPEPDPTPPPVLIPFETFYNLSNDLTEANTVWLNSIAGAAPFFEIYNVADGTDTSDPEVNIYDVADGVGGAGDPFNEFYTYSPSDNSSVQLSTADNTAGGVGVKTGSTIIGKKVTRAKFQLKAESTPTGSVYCRIWDANGNVVVTLDYWNGSTLGTLNAANVASDWTEYEFRNTTYNWGSTSVQNNWVIGIEYTASTDGDTIHVRRQSSGNPMPNEQQAGRDVGDSDFTFDTSNGRDVGAKLSTGLGTTSSDPYLYIQYQAVSPYDRIVQRFGSGDPAVGQIPTKVIVKLQRTGTMNGTIEVDLVTAYNGTRKTLFGTMPASSVSTTPTEYTFTNLNANEPIVANYVLRIICTGMTSGATGTIGVLTNSGTADPHPPAPASNTISYVSRYGGFELTNYTSLDMTGRIYKGGNDFDADVKFTSSLTRVYEKASTVSSSLEGEPLTKATVKLRKFGSPTGLISCVVRRADTDAVRFTVGTYDVSLLTTSYEPITFTNIFNTTLVQLNDRVSFEYSGSDASNYVEILTNKDVFETTHTISGTYSAPVYSDNAQRDISGIFYKGGEPDLASRIRVAQKIITNNSIIDGEKLTKLLVWLRNPNGATGNIHCIIYRGSDDAPIITIDTIPASGVGTGWASYEFENTNNGYVADVDDKVAIVFEGGSSTQRLGVNVRKSTNYDGANSHVVRYNGNEYDDYEEGTWDLVGTMWRGGYMYQPPANAIPDPTPTNNKDLLYCAGNNLLAGFARVLQREFRIYAENTTEAEALNVYENRYSKTARSANEVLIAGIYKPF